MKLSKALQQLEAEAKTTDVFWVEEAKLDFALLLNQRCKHKDIKNKDLAERLKTSQAYITKVFRGDANLTIESMVKLARALGLKLKIDLADDISDTVAEPSTWARPFQKRPKLTIIKTTTVETQGPADWKEAA